MATALQLRSPMSGVNRVPEVTMGMSLPPQQSGLWVKEGLGMPR
jgi:hypothetical protein